MRRLSLISDTADRELDAIRARVRDFSRVGAPRDVVAAIRELALRGKRAEVVDLIGHSRQGFVMLGAWTLDDSPHTSAVVRDELRPALDTIGARTIRLLGCATAATAEARGAMRRIETASGRVVHGTQREVGAHDYDPEGFCGHHLLRDRDGPLAARPDPVGLRDSTATPVRLDALDLGFGPRLDPSDLVVPVTAAIAEQVLDFVDGARSWIGPRFEPVMTVSWLRARLDILCDYHAVRAYGDGDHVGGRVFRVHDADALSAYLDEVTRSRIACPGDTQ